MYWRSEPSVSDGNVLVRRVWTMGGADGPPQIEGW